MEAFPRESGRTKRSRAIAAVLMLALATGCATVSSPWRKSAAIEEEVSQARSAGDHEALAARYEEDAKAARRDAEKHLRMAESYRKMSGAAVSKWHLDRHCVSVAKRYVESAADYEALAKGHREMAREAN